MYSTVCLKRIRRVLTVVYNECVLAIKLEYTFQKLFIMSKTMN